jgi:acetyl-CoA carboxylase carboxyltransferase component
MKSRIQNLKEIKKRILLGGGESKIERQHRAGKLTARERIDLLLDPGTFFEWNILLGHADEVPAEGIVTGTGMINERQVCVFSQDATVLGGSMGHWHGFKM